ncbi:ubiquinone biosynthesis hydroxylase [Bartonella ancashensis]|uniref:2-octaprenyl-3-methyl-6-methoxy-1,4-benzoquinol hydroxylase n=1 Tax=Bartonella ancashensis TaxID=1318743 RepID=A0A0M4M583_9HYPH|nr:ubiquinone biosynthesis hydroxylase [Bartonella ancashensis]ALE03179.1 2-octaprenyl-3-methyl-6-methoxy-1,4-benzoquinol hydroxylase [Bartonella ancashensis]
MPSDIPKNIQHCDLLITGGAAVGLTLAIALKQAAPELQINIVEASPEYAPSSKDIQALSIAASSVRMFQQLQCWEQLIPYIQPIHSMVITDSRACDPFKQPFLTFEGDVTPNEPFAVMVEYNRLLDSLKKRTNDLKIPLINGVNVVDFHCEDQHTIVTLSNGEIWRTPLLIAADGAQSRLRKRANIRHFLRPYKQIAILCTVHHEKPHYGQAIQHFFPTGPFAILPLKGNQSSIVWSEDRKIAQNYLSIDAELFLMELEKRIGHHLGQLSWNGERRGFPLTLALTRQCISPRFALIGDAAHTIHPLAGQGLNLGLHDSAALAQIIIEATRLGLDIGSTTVLERYQSWRRFTVVRMALSNDWLNKLFSNDIFVVRTLRDIGLGLVNQMPKIKRYLIQEASGLTPNAPRLLQGHPL